MSIKIFAELCTLDKKDTDELYKIYNVSNFNQLLNEIEKDYKKHNIDNCLDLLKYKNKELDNITIPVSIIHELTQFTNGKTGQVIEKITKRYLIYNTETKNNEHLIQIVVTNLNLSETLQWTTRIKLKLKDNPINIHILSSKSKDYKDIKPYCTDILNSKGDNSMPNILIMCFHNKRISIDIPYLLDFFNNNKLLNCNIKFHIDFDEPDANTGILDKFLKKCSPYKNLIHGLQFISATFTKKFWKILNNNSNYNNYNEYLEKYQSFNKNNIICHDNDTNNPLDYIKDVIKNKIINKNNRNIIFCPSSLYTGMKNDKTYPCGTHMEMTCYFLNMGFVVYLDNGYFKGFKQKNKEDIDRDEYQKTKDFKNEQKKLILNNIKKIILKNKNNDKIHKSILYEVKKSNLYKIKKICLKNKKNGKIYKLCLFEIEKIDKIELRDIFRIWNILNPKKSLAITGFTTIERGITFNTNGFNFTHAVFSNYHRKNIGKLIQLVGRTTGNKDYIKPINIITLTCIKEQVEKFIDNTIQLKREKIDIYTKGNFIELSNKEKNSIAYTIPIFIELREEEYDLITSNKSYNMKQIQKIIKKKDESIKFEGYVKDQISQPKTDGSYKKNIIKIIENYKRKSTFSIAIKSKNKNKNVYQIWLDYKKKNLYISFYNGELIK